MTDGSGILLTGKEIEKRLNDLASLRLEIFREYPYLYDGRREDELAYLQPYAEKPDSCVILAVEGGVVVGAATGMPLSHEDEQLRAAAAGSAWPVEEIYYVGELLFYPAWRGSGRGRRLLAELENHIRSLGCYRALACVTVERPDDHPARPGEHIPISRFLDRTGFVRQGSVVSFRWRELDGATRDHPMQFWLKDLAGEAG